MSAVSEYTASIVDRLVRPLRKVRKGFTPFIEDDVIMAKITPCMENGKIAHARQLENGIGFGSTEFHVIRAGIAVLPRFVYHLLRQPSVRAAARQQMRGGAGQQRVPADFLRHLEFGLPAKSEQRRIVEILDQADRLRQLRRAADEKAQRIIPALFYKMFGDPATNPKGLPRRKLGALIKVKSGEFLPAKDMDVFGKYPVYGGNGITGYHSEFMFDEAVIVIGRVGVYCGAIHYTQPRCWVTDNALYVSDCVPDLRPRYLEHALRMANLNRYAGRAGQPLISAGRIYPVEILVPSSKQQEQFGRAVDGIDDGNKRLRALDEQVRRLYDVLLHRAFTGGLTAKWREAHKEQLEAELREQLAALERARTERPRRGRGRPAPPDSAAGASERHAGYDMFNKAALVTYIVDRCHDPRRPHGLGRTKLAKLFYLVQRRSEVALTEQFARRAAGPLDDTIHKFLNLARKRGWLDLPPAEGQLKPVVPGRDPQPAVDHVRQRWSAVLPAIDQMLDTMKGWGWETLERWATVLHVAENLLAEGKPLTPAAVKAAIAACPEWRAKLDRAAFSDDEIQSTLAGLRRYGFLPASDRAANSARGERTP
jgi:type I restriction enzyme S subunit